MRGIFSCGRQGVSTSDRRELFHVAGGGFFHVAGGEFCQAEFYTWPTWNFHVAAEGFFHAGGGESR